MSILVARNTSQLGVVAGSELMDTPINSDGNIDGIDPPDSARLLVQHETAGVISEDKSSPNFPDSACSTHTGSVAVNATIKPLYENENMSCGDWSLCPPPPPYDSFKLAHCTLHTGPRNHPQLRYSICLTDREVYHLTGKIIPSRSTRVRNLPLSTEHSRSGIDHVTVQSREESGLHEQASQIIPEFIALRDPQALAPRERLVNVCALDLKYMLDEETRYIGLEAQKRIISFIRTAFGNSSAIYRASALIDCIIDCEKIVRDGVAVGSVLLEKKRLERRKREDLLESQEYNAALI